MKTLYAATAAAMLCTPTIASAGTSEFFATIRADGTILRGSGVTASGRAKVGLYMVAFPRHIHTCNMTATAKSNDVVTVEAISAPKTQLWVRIWRGETASDASFNILVKCQK